MRSRRKSIQYSNSGGYQRSKRWVDLTKDLVKIGINDWKLSLLIFFLLKSSIKLNANPESEYTKGQNNILQVLLWPPSTDVYLRGFCGFFLHLLWIFFAKVEQKKNILKKAQKITVLQVAHEFSIFFSFSSKNPDNFFIHIKMHYKSNARNIF